jgi:hypothetical protein
MKSATTGHREKKAVTRRNATSALARRLAARLRDALSEAETTDFRAVDEVLVEGVQTAQLKDLPRDQLHRLLLFSLSETVLVDSARRSKDWILDAVQLFLARAAAASH